MRVKIDDGGAVREKVKRCLGEEQKEAGVSCLVLPAEVASRQA